LEFAPSGRSGCPEFEDVRLGASVRFLSS